MIKINRGGAQQHIHNILFHKRRRTRNNHHFYCAASFNNFSSSSPPPPPPSSETNSINNDDDNNQSQHQSVQSQSRPKAAAVVVRSALLTTNNNMHDDDCDDGSTSTSTSTSTIEYTRGWAWQQLILHRKLENKRRQRISRSSNNRDDNDNNDNKDVILFFEHQPVYTLGRGSDENHFQFIKNRDPRYTDLEIRQKLARTRSRGPNNSARLGITDRDMRTLLVENDDNHNTNNDDISIIENIILSRASSVSPVIAPNDAKIYRVERGGEVTYHGPGQLVVYPIFDLERESSNSSYKKDLHWYLRMVEEVIIRTLRDEYGIVNAVRDPINTGVWVNQRKIAAVGVSASRWITTHGFAINVNPNLSYFDKSIIVPCGIEGRGVTSIANEMNNMSTQHQETTTTKVPSVQHVSETVVQKFQEVFDIDIEIGPALR